MAFASRHLVPALAVFAVATMLPHHSAGADPDIDTESASAVIAELQEQGYEVRIKGVSTANASLLTTCKVTKIQDSGQPTPDPTTTTVVDVDVACPIEKS